MEERQTCLGVKERVYSALRSFLFSLWNITSSPLLPDTHIPFIILTVTMPKVCFPPVCLYKDTMSLQVGAILQVKLLTLAGKEKRRQGLGWGPESTGHCRGTVTGRALWHDTKIIHQVWRQNPSQALPPTSWSITGISVHVSGLSLLICEEGAVRDVCSGPLILWLLQGLFSLRVGNNRGPGLENDLTTLRHKQKCV